MEALRLRGSNAASCFRSKERIDRSNELASSKERQSKMKDLITKKLIKSIKMEEQLKFSRFNALSGGYSSRDHDAFNNIQTLNPDQPIRSNKQTIKQSKYRIMQQLIESEIDGYFVQNKSLGHKQVKLIKMKVLDKFKQINKTRNENLKEGQNTADTSIAQFPQQKLSELHLAGASSLRKSFDVINTNLDNRFSTINNTYDTRIESSQFRTSKVGDVPKIVPFSNNQNKELSKSQCQANASEIRYSNPPKIHDPDFKMPKVDQFRSNVQSRNQSRLFANKTSEDCIPQSGKQSNMWRGWDQIVEYNSMLDKLSKSQEREDKIKRISNIKDMLNTQILEHREQKKIAELEKFKLQKEITEIIKQDKLEKERIRMEFKNRILQEKSRRDEQLILKQREKELESKQQKLAEQKLLDTLQQDLKVEKSMALEKRKLRQQEYKQVLFENEVAKAERVRQKEKEKAKDTEDIIKYTKFLEEQEKKRKAEIERKDQILHARLLHMKESVIDKLNIKEKEEEKRLIADITEKERKEGLREKEKALRVRRDQKEFRDFLSRQIQEKKLKQEWESEKNEVWIRQILEKDERERQDQKEKERLQKEEINRNKIDIEKQIEEKKIKKTTEMNDQEFKMNIDIINEFNRLKGTKVNDEVLYG